MKKNIPNMLTFDQRLTLPRDTKQPSIGELTQNIPTDFLIEKAEEINQLNLSNKFQPDNDIYTILQADDHNLKGIALGCLTGIHTFNGNYKKAITCVNQALELNVKNEVNAYILTEYANLLRQLGRIDEALAILESAYNITTNEELKWRIITVQGYSFRYIDKDISLEHLGKASKYYLDHNNIAKYATVRRHMGLTLMKYKDLDQATDIFNEVIHIAISNTFNTILFGATSDLAWISVERKEYTKAKSNYTNLLKNKMIPFSECITIQNLAYIEFEQNNYRESIEYQLQSLELSQKYEMLDMLFEDYYKLGLAYEKLGDLQNAKKYYSEGYDQLQKERAELGIILTSGYRGELFDNYFRIMESINK